MCAHIMHQSHLDCNAFLGGISKNYGTNYILSDCSDFVVIEADEFDRSFHWLRPWMSVITSTGQKRLTSRVSAIIRNSSRKAAHSFSTRD